tara:strand:+ start:303 stop:485 length:183 start_codon:yes stop_codon:yes gene_type:complete
MDSSMTILSAQYIAIDNVNDTVKATIDGQELSVPLDPANRHYAEILRQVEAGTLTIAAAD